MLDRPTRINERFPLVMDPPFRFDRTRAFLFAVECDAGRLDALLARTFAWAAPEVEVERLGHHCLVVATDVGEGRTADAALGWFAYREITFFVPVWGRRAGVPFVALHVPFIYPDDGLALAAGREVYGLPKKPARIVMPSAASFWSGAEPIAASVRGVERFDGSEWTERTLLTITSSGSSAISALASALAGSIDALLAAVPAGLGSVSDLLRQDLLQLKQVPDVSTGGVPARVLYRALTHVRAPVRDVRDIALADPARVRIELADLASEPVRDVLGLPAVVTPKLAVSLEMDFAFDPGETWLERPDETPAPTRKTRVLVLGGGMAGLAAAHALSDTDARRRKYDVRVLAQGHLLGGKGANVRNPARAERIEEHGLHVIFGFYHNFLRLMRSVYAEAARDAHSEPSTFDEAFKPEWRVTFHDGTGDWEAVFPRTPATYGAGRNTPGELVEAAAAFLEASIGFGLNQLLANPFDPPNPIVRDAVWFIATLIKGVTDDLVFGSETWDDLDRQDFRAWMASHRLPFSPDLSRSALMQVPYDGVFAYLGGDQSRPRLCAGIAARGLLKLVGDYERAPYWTMTAGMGETVFAPLYEVLRARGVRIEFFAKVKELRMVGGRLDEVVFGRQARVTAGPDAYRPLVTVGQVTCFRHEPDLAQLVAPAPIAGKDPYSDAVYDQDGPDVRIRDGSDFDYVICALPAPVTAHVLRGHTGHPVLSRIAGIPTVATLHLQAWLREDTRLLGWKWTSRVLGSFRQPLNSMLDEHPLLGIEQWPAPGPRGLLYLSGPFGPGFATNSEDAGERAAAETAAFAEAARFVDEELWRVLPAARDPATGGFDMSRLHAPWTPADPLRDQYVRGNIDRSARYTLIEPATAANRPEPAPAGLVNLRFAGDWTKNGVDVPCMEGTVTSALLAANSILGALDAVEILT
ncbi:MAG TPA: FAD-dependent oxidoreductase [Polyangiaceae bacterium]